MPFKPLQLSFGAMTSKTFCGVFPSNKLPQTIEKYPSLIRWKTGPRLQTF